MRPSENASVFCGWGGVWARASSPRRSEQARKTSRRSKRARDASAQPGSRELQKRWVSAWTRFSRRPPGLRIPRARNEQASALPAPFIDPARSTRGGGTPPLGARPAHQTPMSEPSPPEISRRKLDELEGLPDGALDRLRRVGR